jgi:hypothetical protein
VNEVDVALSKKWRENSEEFRRIMVAGDGDNLCTSIGEALQRFQYEPERAERRKAFVEEVPSHEDDIHV